jgi:hypothetical protein
VIVATDRCSLGSRGRARVRVVATTFRSEPVHLPGPRARIRKAGRSGPTLLRQQGADMADVEVFVGIDVSKARLDVATVPGEHASRPHSLAVSRDSSLTKDTATRAPAAERQYR